MTLFSVLNLFVQKYLLGTYYVPATLPATGFQFPFICVIISFIIHYLIMCRYARSFEKNPPSHRKIGGEFFKSVAETMKQDFL